MKVFLDVGAHTGETLGIALEDKYRFDKIYCFEPVSECCDSLKNFKDERVVVCEYGLWDKNCTREIYNPKSKGASVFKDKFRHPVNSQKVRFVSAGEWFAKNLKTDDKVYLKLNCEGAECTILDDLIKTGEYKKIDVLMVDFDVRKISSQNHLVPKVKKKLKKLGIPKMFFIDEYKLGPGTHNYFTHLWLDESLEKTEKKSFKSTKALGYILKKYGLDPSLPSPIEIPNVCRDSIVTWLKDLNFKKGVEVGVMKGEFGEKLAKANPQMKIWGVDSWEEYDEYADFKENDFFEKSYKEAKKRLSKYPNYKIIKSYSFDAMKKFKNNFLDFVYIDANHQESYVLEDIAGWSKKVKKGGIVAGHDYIRLKAPHSWCGVVNAVNKFVNKYNIKPWFLLGLKAKMPGVIRDKHRSWMWIKQ